MAYDLEAARNAGVQDADIAEALSKKLRYDLTGARKAGVPDADIVSALVQRENSTSPRVLNRPPTVNDIPGAPPQRPKEEPKQRSMLESFGNYMAGPYEAAASMATAIPAQLVGNTVGLVKGVTGGKYGTPEGAREAAATADRVSQGLTYSPRTEGGKSVLDAVGKVIDESKIAGLPPTIPARMPAAAAVKPSPKIAAAATAEQWVKANTDLDWSKLSRSVRDRLVDYAEDATKLKDLDPKAVQRQVRAGSLPEPVKLTQGQAERNPGKLRAEENLAQTDSGTPIRERQMDQTEALTRNLDILQGRTGQRATGEQAGVKLAEKRPKGDTTAPEGALAMADRKSRENVSKLYKQVEKSPEGQMPVSPGPMIEWLTKNGAKAASVPEIKSIADTLKKFGAVEFDEAGNAKPRRDLTINEMEEVRKTAVQLAEQGKPSGALMGELKGVIDKATEAAGGDMYKAARAARNEHAMKFEEPKAIAQLIEEKSRTDRKVALEDTWDKTVRGGSIKDLQRVRDTLLDNSDRRVRDAGRKAWRDIAGQTVEYVKEKALSGATDQRGNVNISAPKLKAALDDIGDAKLKVILGETATAELRKLADVAIDTKTMPPFKGGSTTVPNGMALLNVLDKAMGKIPIAGKIAQGGARMASKAYREGQAAQEAKNATSSFLDRMAPRQPVYTMDQLIDQVVRPTAGSLPAAGPGMLPAPLENRRQ